MTKNVRTFFSTLGAVIGLIGSAVLAEETDLTLLFVQTSQHVSINSENGMNRQVYMLMKRQLANGTGDIYAIVV